MKPFLPTLFVFVLGIFAGNVCALEPVVAAPEPVVSQPAVKNPDAPQALKAATAKKYVRNITLPNGFGESFKVGEASFFAKSADVKANHGDILEYAIVLNVENMDVTDASIRDAIPAFTEYVAGSTRLNNIAVADVEGISKVVAGVLVNDVESPLHSGLLHVGKPAVLVYQVKVNLMQELSPAAAGAALIPVPAQPAPVEAE